MSLEIKYKDEINWWEGILTPGKRQEWMDDMIIPETRARNTPPKLFDFINELQINRIPKVLDVGCGPLSPLAWGVDQKMIEVTAIDPLAEIYSEILKKLNINFPIKPIQGVGEKIAGMFEKEYFDVVFSRNALDHSDSPTECIDNMVTVLKKGGILYLEGFTNEGTANYWKGLHLWDLRHDNGNLLCTAKSKKVTNLTQALPLECFFTYGPDNNRWYRIAFKKTNI